MLKHVPKARSIHVDKRNGDKSFDLVTMISVMHIAISITETKNPQF